ncbi:protein IWS1 homolog A [Amborella trichopoda]|uniref:Uncharacterized protein n=1 Tax=Amborella trichopoda TaxID=13333 RepID=W1PJQ6_AMBTC|nr:protein IWS1 homolog A [Amborella trichopoda]ERN10197.1 hypothetical protein AMTR_s00171p00029360 [Amborella trichopoda]|eukprot:XP_006848616.1 protein IWS1 homolog A [Amborella trichopoda]
MVVRVGPSKFYGSGLPRPRIYNNIEGNERVDPPLPVMAPLLQWANEAHWSRGGLSFKRRSRMQGKLEGNIRKLRAQIDDDDDDDVVVTMMMKRKEKKEVQEKGVSPTETAAKNALPEEEAPSPGTYNRSKRVRKRLLEDGDDDHEFKSTQRDTLPVQRSSRKVRSELMVEAEELGPTAMDEDANLNKAAPSSTRGKTKKLFEVEEEEGKSKKRRSKQRSSK